MRLPPPMTAPVTAILATLTDDEVGLRCRPLILRSVPLFDAPARSAVGFGLERSPGRRRLWWKRFRLHPKESHAAPSPVGGPVGPPPPSMVFVGLPAPWMELSAKSGKGLPGLRGLTSDRR